MNVRKRLAVFGVTATVIGSLVLGAAGPAQAATPKCGGKTATIVGSNDADSLIGTSGNDVIVGLGGADYIEGGGGNDIICGGKGEDLITGGAGNDTIFGDAGWTRSSPTPATTPCAAAAATT